MIATAVENTKTAWLGEFPAHWQVLRIKNLFQELDSRSETGSEELLSVSHYTGVTLKRESLENEDDHLTNAESLVGYKLVEQGDLVINIMLAWNGSLGISPYNGITSPAYCVYRIKGDNNPEYFGYLFTTNLFKAEFRRNSTGIIDSRLRLYSDKFFSIFTLVPPKNEQDEIVQNIKTIEGKITRFIGSKLGFISLLEEQKTAIINQICLNGINQKKFIDTNDDRFNKIPSSWQYKRLKFLIRERNIRSETGEEELLSLSQYKGIIPKKSLEERAGMAESLVGYKIVELNNLVINKMQAANGLVGISELFGITSPDYAIFEPTTDEVFMPYLGYLFKTSASRSHFYSRSKGVMAGYIRLYSDQLLDLKIPLPPFEEQKQIVTHIKTETSTIDTAIAKAEREIELIREYKDAMISEAVMGKRIIFV
ncbi:MAG TPA: restriction endonuclease subunit S [Bacteroidales bacterium]|nr:restriction endonuclease subunit S [Bacteroidales bacterium]